MFHLIQPLIPRPLHRLALKVAHKVRHRWRHWRRVRLEGVSIIARNAAGDILLVRHAYGPDFWTLPGGGMKRGEPPVETAIRETREELGVLLHDPVLLGEVEESLSGSPHTAHVVAGTLRDTPQADGREIAKAQFFPLNALPEPVSPLVAPRLALLEQR